MLQITVLYPGNKEIIKFDSFNRAMATVVKMLQYGYKMIQRTDNGWIFSIQGGKV